MSDKELTPLSASARINAQVEAKLRGPERGMLVAATFAFLFFVSSLIALSINASLWPAYFSLFGGLLAGGFLLRYWLKQPKHQPYEGPLTEVVASAEGITISAPARSPEEIIALVREAIQSRKPLPPPHGAVTNENPAQTDNLREYSAEERKQVLEDLKQAIKENDLRAVEQLRKMVPDSTALSQLEAAVASEDTQMGTQD